jgi:hypothetical protein
MKICDGISDPVARNRVCPEVDPLVEPSFVVTVSAVAPEGGGNYRYHIVPLGNVMPAGLMAS